MVGKGSVNHNSRKFHAKNTDPERADLNREYCSEDIRKVYRELFDDAVKRYNEKQTRNDRMITDYYKKIRTGKQEKPFHEIILQIGNRDDMNAKTFGGTRAANILDEYMQSFQERNPNIRVFSAYLHMDEATPHLHIDFVPFTTGSKRGLDTRVSLKQALAAQGFHGGSRQETEWNQWVFSEKEQLAAVMERHGIEWEQKGIQREHLSVLEYKKEQRSQEVAQLKNTVEDLKVVAQEKSEKADKIQDRLERLKSRESLIGQNMYKYDNDSEWQLPEPPKLSTAKSYMTKTVEPFVKKLKRVIKSVVAQCLDLMKTVRDLENRLHREQAANDRLHDRIDTMKHENKQLTETVKDYRRVRKVLGDDKVDGIVAEAKAAEQQAQISKRNTRSKGWER